jgi:glycolate oxidase
MSGEHGVGIMKAPFLPMELKENTIDYMKTIKQALDPKNILNPGKIFPSDLPH